MSLRLATSPRMRQFCGIDGIESVRIPSKCRLQTYATWLPEEMMRPILAQLLCCAST